jgi:hypothetical protein
VSEVRDVLAAQGFQGIATQPTSELHGKTAAERQAFKQVRGLVFGRWRGGLAIMFVMSDDSSARVLYQLAQREGARFGRSRLKGAAVRNVLIDYIRPATGPDRVQAGRGALPVSRRAGGNPHPPEFRFNLT